MPLIPKGYVICLACKGERQVFGEAPLTPRGFLWDRFFRGSFTMTDRRRDLALAIKSCLDSLADDAANNDLADLAHFVGLGVARRRGSGAGGRSTLHHIRRR